MKSALILLALLLSACAAEHPEVAEVAQPHFEIIAGDVLQVSVWKEDELNREVLVFPNGEITFPLVGTIKAEGLTPAQLQDTIKTKLKKYIPSATVSVTIKAALGHTVSVVGQVNKPGEMIITHRLTTLQALSQAGGLTPFASERNIIIVRHTGDKDISIPVPYHDFVDGDELDKDITLQPGDVVIVPTSSLF